MREYGLEEYKSRIIDAIQSDPVLKNYEVTVSDKIRLWASEGDSFSLDVNGLYSSFVPAYSVVSSLRGELIMAGFIDPPSTDFVPRFVTEVVNIKHVQLNEVYKTVVGYSDIVLLLKCSVDETEHYTSLIAVREEALSTFKMTADEAFDLALKNTQTIYPATIFSFREMADHFLNWTLNDRNLLSEATKEDADLSDMFVSVKGCLRGAVAIFYPETLPKLYELIGEDFYVVFTSRHEAAIHPKSHIHDEADLAHILFETIEDSVTDEDFLTYDIFMCQKADDGSLKLVKV